MSDLHVVPGNEGFGLIDHIKALDVRVGRLEMLLAAKFPDEAQGSGYTHGWDKGFAGEGDPYSIGTEYVAQSANPDAAPTSASTEAAYYIAEEVDGRFSLTCDGARIGDFPTREDAEKAEAIARA